MLKTDHSAQCGLLPAKSTNKKQSAFNRQQTGGSVLYLSTAVTSQKCTLLVWKSCGIIGKANPIKLGQVLKFQDRFGYLRDFI